MSKILLIILLEHLSGLEPLLLTWKDNVLTIEHYRCVKLFRTHIYILTHILWKSIGLVYIKVINYTSLHSNTISNFLFVTHLYNPFLYNMPNNGYLWFLCIVLCIPLKILNIPHQFQIRIST